METIKRHGTARNRLDGTAPQAIIGVVASGNLEVLLERTLDGAAYEIEVATSVAGYRDVWDLVLDEFVRRFSPGGLRISVNDSGARPDAVTIRLAQGVRLMEAHA